MGIQMLFGALIRFGNIRYLDTDTTWFTDTIRAISVRTMSVARRAGGQRRVAGEPWLPLPSPAPLAAPMVRAFALGCRKLSA